MGAQKVGNSSFPSPSLHVEEPGNKRAEPCLQDGGVGAFSAGVPAVGSSPELEVTRASWFCSCARIIVLWWFPLCNPVLLSIFCAEGTQCSDLKGKSLKSPWSRKGQEKARCQECQQAVSMTILILTMSIKKTRNPPWRLLLQLGCWGAWLWRGRLEPAATASWRPPRLMAPSSLPAPGTRTTTKLFGGLASSCQRLYHVSCTGGCCGKPFYSGDECVLCIELLFWCCSHSFVLWRDSILKGTNVRKIKIFLWANAIFILWCDA